MWYTLESLETLVVSTNPFPRDEFGAKNHFIYSHRRFGSSSLQKVHPTPRCSREHLQLERLRKMLRVYDKNLFKKILFIDEKVFTIKQKFNKQNDKLYA